MTHPAEAGSIVGALGPEGLSRLEQAGERVSIEPGTLLSDVGDPVDELLLILSGAVEVKLVLDGGVERLVGTLRDGGLLGALAMSGPMLAQARSRAAEATEAIRIRVDALQALLAGDTALAARVLPAILAQTARQARIAVADLVATAQWSARVSGLTQLGFAELLAGADAVTLRLVDGRSLRGRVVRLDLHDGGGYLVLDDGEGTLHVVRGAGIVSAERPPVIGPEA